MWYTACALEETLLHMMTMTPMEPPTMILFGPPLVEHLPHWPPAETPDFWLVTPDTVQEWPKMPSQIERVIQWRSLEPLEWVELAARLGREFGSFDYEIMRAAATNASEFVTATGEIVPTAPVLSLLSTACREWCSSRWASNDVLMVNQYGRIYRRRGISWEECE